MALAKSEVAPSGIPNYRQQLRKVLPPDILDRSLASLWWFPVHAAIIGTSFWLLASHFTWWMAPLLSLVIGHSFACMGFLAHDIGHGASVRSPLLRDFLSGAGFSPLFISPLLWRKWHNSDHHNNTQVEGLDPDHLFTIEDYKNNAVLRGLYKLSPLARNLVIFGSFTFRMTQQTERMLITYLRSKKVSGREKFTMVAQSVAQLSFWVVLTSLLGSQVFIWGYFVPVLVANAIAISYIATNHFLNPLADERDVLATSLSVTLPGPLSWLDPWHSHFGAHVAHHLFPGAPASRARQIELKIMELWPDRYHCMPITQALKHLWNTPWIYEDKTTFIDPRRMERAGTLGHGLGYIRSKFKRKPQQ